MFSAAKNKDSNRYKTDVSVVRTKSFKIERGRGDTALRTSQIASHFACRVFGSLARETASELQSRRTMRPRVARASCNTPSHPSPAPLRMRTPSHTLPSPNDAARSPSTSTVEALGRLPRSLRLLCAHIHQAAGLGAHATAFDLELSFFIVCPTLFGVGLMDVNASCSLASTHRI